MTNDSDDLVETVRAAILTAAPDMTENVKWNSPNFVHEGVDRLTVRIRPRGGLQLIFHRGAKIRSDAADFRFDDPAGVLDWPSPDRAVLALTDLDEASAKSSLITDYVRRWLATP